MNNVFAEEDRKFALENCKMLYRDIHKPCTETCACWQWETSPAWYSILKKLSTKLELLNLEYCPKYGVQVIMEQCKSKFGTLHFYHSTIINKPLIYRMWAAPFFALSRYLRYKVDYKMKQEVVREPYVEDKKKEIAESDVEEQKKRAEHISNVEIIEENGKWYEVIHIQHYREFRSIPTRFKLLYKLINPISYIAYLLDFNYTATPTQRIVQDAVNQKAEAYIREAEKECFNVCEECGTQIGTDYSPRITTKGWISYICERCDAKNKITRTLDSINYLVERAGINLNAEDSKIVEECKNVTTTNEFVYTETMVECAKKIQDVLINLKKSEPVKEA